LELVKHTLATLGPKVLATRMVQDYVNNLYTPAAVASRQVNADDARLAKELAAWKARIRTIWSGVNVEHIEAENIPDSPQRGDVITLNAFVNLAGLNPQEVAVELVHGRADSNDRIADPSVVELTAADQFDGSRWRFTVNVELQNAGAFGYNVRVVPKHAGLANFAELGLQASLK
jgi:starch phosphorylase